MLNICLIYGVFKIKKTNLHMFYPDHATVNLEMVWETVS
jgi:hypothetical protein